MSKTIKMPRTSYDETPYESFPFPQTHPNRLATLGYLFGLEPPPLAGCRVLELGCAGGGNLIPMAVGMPNASFIGIDLSTVQVTQGKKIIADLGLSNIELRDASITDVDDSLGKFDYILCHGVYSWVPDVVREKILDIIASQLSPQGIAYISYNTLPGWHMRGMIRDLMRFQAMQFTDPSHRVSQARAILDFLAKWVPTENNAYGMLLKSELDSLRASPDYYILHEHLEDINHPVYFHEFVESAGRHGLQYLAEADFSTMLASNFPSEVNETVMRIAPDVIRQEQFMDFLRSRTFRQTLLVRQALQIKRALSPERVMPMWISGTLLPVNASPSLAPEREEAFRSANGGILKTPNPITKAAIVLLSKRWPEAIAFSDLFREALHLLGQQPAQSGLSFKDTLASDVLQCYAAGLLELHAYPSHFVTKAGNKPVASSLARWQAAQGFTSITTLRHETVHIDSNIGRFLQLLDGTLDKEAIYRTVTDWALASSVGKKTHRKDVTGPTRKRVDETLILLARSALLLA